MWKLRRKRRHSSVTRHAERSQRAGATPLQMRRCAYNHSWYFRRESVYLERFFRNLLLGENNELRNRFMVINAPKDMGISTPTSTPTSSDNPLQIDNENISRLIKAIANNRLSVKEMMASVGLKNRENFMEYSLNPAMKEGFVSMLYPDKPRHPRQKYLLTIKGWAVYNSNNRK